MFAVLANAVATSPNPHLTTFLVMSYMVDTWCMMQVEYLLCYAAAGTFMRFCALRRDNKRDVHHLGPLCDLSQPDGLLTAIGMLMLTANIVCAQRKQLPDKFRVADSVVRTNGTTITWCDNYVNKSIDLAKFCITETRRAELAELYKVVSACPTIIHALKDPQLTRRHYSVGLQPIGEPVSSPPTAPEELQAVTRSVIVRSCEQSCSRT
jgi:hypothetical protein